ncbi:hypothetical protein D1007_22611 [Hordeum vulgare]|uniref:Bifunctional inhibitor/plant lipid transfer protein/seed storage helical domain-containing protein n=1 Tax=Hordeum vulgare subsp. vulgare TaxID=112509 RepID=A0A8I6Y5U7_HORVV|nr:uncharacterized protein LOC123403100 [Hordeum vulgare subsp. vulgare]KAE8801813.1 hypothetical protein D1007_22611 [Hordeum vulgare]
MASVKLAVVLLACAALMATAAAYAPYRPEPEPCKTQAMYFKNCLFRGHGKMCCSGVVADPSCYCEVEREVEIQCTPDHHCHGAARMVKVAEMDLPCMKDLKCKHA